MSNHQSVMELLETSAVGQSMIAEAKAQQLAEQRRLAEEYRRLDRPLEDQLARLHLQLRGWCHGERAALSSEAIGLETRRAGLRSRYRGKIREAVPLWLEGIDRWLAELEKAHPGPGLIAGRTFDAMARWKLVEATRRKLEDEVLFSDDLPGQLGRLRQDFEQALAALPVEERRQGAAPFRNKIHLPMGGTKEVEGTFPMPEILPPVRRGPYLGADGQPVPAPHTQEFYDQASGK